MQEQNSFIESYFEELRYYLNPVFQYKQGNCHNVTHFASLILNKYQVSHKKIWIYAPTRFDENSKATIQFPDPNYISPKGLLSWGFHVALLVKNANQDFVVDFFIDDQKPLTISHWLEAIRIKDFKLDIGNPENYLFYTNESKLKKNGIFNGEYFEYEGFCKDNEWIPKGLAINETAIAFYKKEFYHFHYHTPLSNDYRLLVGRVNNFECVFRDNSFNEKVNQNFQKKHLPLINNYRLVYEENLSKWRNWVDTFI